MLYRYRNNFQKKNEKNDALIFPAHNFHSLEIPFSKGEKLSYRNRTKDTVGRESALKLVTSPSFLSLSLSYSSSSTTRSGLSKPWHERCIDASRSTSNFEHIVKYSENENVEQREGIPWRTIYSHLPSPHWSNSTRKRHACPMIENQPRWKRTIRMPVRRWNVRIWTSVDFQSLIFIATCALKVEAKKI